MRLWLITLTFLILTASVVWAAWFSPWAKAPVQTEPVVFIEPE